MRSQANAGSTECRCRQSTGSLHCPAESSGQRCPANPTPISGRNIESGGTMKLHFPAVLLILACFISGGARAQSADNDGCTNAALFGDYAFRVDGQLLPQGGPPIERQGVAMTHFDGAGRLTQVDFVMSNGAPMPGPADPVSGFHID